MTVIISGNGPAAFPDANGNLGLGTTTPTAKLQISSPGGWSAFNYGKGLYVTTTSGAANPAIGISDYTGSNNWGIINASGKLFFSTMPAITDSSSSTTTRIVVDTSGNLGIGTESPGSKLDIISESAGDGSRITNYMGSSATGLFLTLRTARGTVASPSAVQVGDRIGAIGMGGSTTGSAFYNSALITSYIDSGTVSATSLPTYMSFWTTPDGTLSRTERMRIDSSGNVGIGTSSPACPLQVVKNQAFTTSVVVSNNNATWDSNFTATNGTSSILMGYANSSYGGYRGITANGGYIYTTGTAGMQLSADQGPIQFFTSAGSERMRIDSSGNVGIGVSPSTTYALRQLYMPTNGGTAVLGSAAYHTTNAYFDSAWKYYATGGAAQYQQASNVHTWSYAASGSANTAITWSEAMRIDSSGNVGIGTSSPDQLLTVNSANITTNSVVSYKQGGTTYGYTGLGQTNQMALQASVQLNVQTTTATPITFITNNAERMRIDSSGNVGIGTASPSAKLQIQGSQASGTANVLYLDNSSATGTTLASVSFSNAGSVKASIAACVAGDGYMTFNNNNNSEKMRIDASGNVGIGTSTPAAALEVSRAGSSEIRATTTTSTGNVAVVKVKGPVSNYGIFTVDNANYLAFYDYTASAERMRIDSSGNVGIGTTSPASTLHVAKTTSSGTYRTELRIDNQDQRTTLASYYQSGVAQRSILRSEAIAAGSAIPIAFEVGSTEAMRIDSSGRVGIGTTSPIRILNVNGSVASSVGTVEMSLTAAATTGTAFINVSDNAGSNGSGWDLQIRGLATSGSATVNLGTVSVSATNTYFNGNVNPATTNSYDLGSSSYRWRNIYTQDLHLSNGIGDYTVVEGEEDLFLVNNKSGKTFKFALIEVDPSTIPPKSET